MFKSMMLGLVMAGATATSGWAQCACSGGSIVTSTPTNVSSEVAVAGSGQGYQRFSYAPSEMTVAPMVQYSAAPMSRPLDVQNYRPFSYQPATRSNTAHSMPQYLYPKADSRRYSH